MKLLMHSISPGKQIDGIWHTAVVIYGQEFFYGGGGIESCQPVRQCKHTRFKFNMLI